MSNKEETKVKVSRRDFLKLSQAVAAGASVEVASRVVIGGQPPPLSQPQRHTGAAEASRSAVEATSAQRAGGSSHITKGILLDMLPKNLSYADRFKMARDTGFEVLQAPTTPEQGEAEEMAKAAQDTGVRIDSVMNMLHWQYPLSSSDPAVVEKSLEGMRTSLQNAKLWGAGAVLLVPAVVNPTTTYRQAWHRSAKQIRTLIPLAAELKVVIAIEEVWNKFLLSPLEMSAYLDQFNSPWIQSWFDVGNVVLYGYPQDWIHTLGSRINRLHLKDFKMEKNSFYWANLGDGDIDWVAMRNALVEIGFRGSAICELRGGNGTYLRDLSERVDRLVLGKSSG
jgi:L-ribulose-5-phosphate 3-epimerase